MHFLICIIFLFCSCNFLLNIIISASSMIHDVLWRVEIPLPNSRQPPLIVFIHSYIVSFDILNSKAVLAAELIFLTRLYALYHIDIAKTLANSSLPHSLPIIIIKLKVLQHYFITSLG